MLYILFYGLIILLILIALLLLRIAYLIGSIIFKKLENPTKRTNLVRTMICIGSGGHTTEMLQLIKTISPNHYSPRYYILADSDTTSENKIIKTENEVIESQDIATINYELVKIPRSRIVGQSYITSIFTTLYSILLSIPIMLNIKPELILCNGPGTCIPICLIGFLMKALCLCDCKIIFVESFCRTKSFSLSGKILMFFADNIVVQWPNFKSPIRKIDYIGQLL